MEIKFITMYELKGFFYDKILYINDNLNDEEVKKLIERVIK